MKKRGKRKETGSDIYSAKPILFNFQSEILLGDLVRWLYVALSAWIRTGYFSPVYVHTYLPIYDLRWYA